MAPFAPARTRPAPLRPALHLLAAAALAASAPAFAQAQAQAKTQPQPPQKLKTQAEEQAAPPERTLPQVVVQAQRLARDGISDSTAYTTRGAQVAGKTPRALREIPQSVTVFTEQRLRD
ncbi:MAG: hypothetical protein ACTTKK_04800 [Ottowia sp.]